MTKARSLVPKGSSEANDAALNIYSVSTFHNLQIQEEQDDRKGFCAIKATFPCSRMFPKLHEKQTNSY